MMMLQSHRNTTAGNMRTEPLPTVHNGNSGYLLRERITYPPNKRDYVISGRHISTCPVCGDRFGHMQTHAKYCSNACRVKAARIRAGRCSNRREAAQAAVHTKHSTNHRLTCQCCQREFWGNGFDAGLRLYCSDACKQKAYRQRKSTAPHIQARNTTSESEEK
jgi:hypothetical protein